MRCFARISLMCLLTVVAASSLVGCVSYGGRGDAATDADRMRARRQRDDGAPKVGDVAPLFTLKMLEDENRTVELAAFREVKPVVLFFGSYT